MKSTGCWLQDSRDSLRHPSVTFQFVFQLFSAGLRKPVETGAAVLLRLAPLAFDPALDEHALEGRVERALLHMENILGSLLNGVGNLKPVQIRTSRQRQIGRA